MGNGVQVGGLVVEPVEQRVRHRFDAACTAAQVDDQLGGLLRHGSVLVEQPGRLVVVELPHREHTRAVFQPLEGAGAHRLLDGEVPGAQVLARAVGVAHHEVRGVVEEERPVLALGYLASRGVADGVGEVRLGLALVDELDGVARDHARVGPRLGDIELVAVAAHGKAAGLGLVAGLGPAEEAQVVVA